MTYEDLKLTYLHEIRQKDDNIAQQKIEKFEYLSRYKSIFEPDKFGNPMSKFQNVANPQQNCQSMIRILQILHYKTPYLYLEELEEELITEIFEVQGKKEFDHLILAIKNILQESVSRNYTPNYFPIVSPQQQMMNISPNIQRMSPSVIQHQLATLSPMQSTPLIENNSSTGTESKEENTSEHSKILRLPMIENDKFFKVKYCKIIQDIRDKSSCHEDPMGHIGIIQSDHFRENCHKYHSTYEMFFWNTFALVRFIVDNMEKNNGHYKKALGKINLGYEISENNCSFVYNHQIYDEYNFYDILNNPKKNSNESEKNKYLYNNLGAIPEIVENLWMILISDYDFAKSSLSKEKEFLYNLGYITTWKTRRLNEQKQFEINFSFEDCDDCHDDEPKSPTDIHDEEEFPNLEIAVYKK